MLNQRETARLSYGLAPPAFRLPDATHVGGVRLQVSDLPRSVEYYAQVLGLRVYTVASDRATLGPHGEDGSLVTLQTGGGVRPARRGTFGLYHFAILLPERAALGRFAAHLSALGVRVGMADHLVSVIAAGGGEAWDGAPTGTTMGHVHLHVGSLDTAEAFYHRALGFDKTVWSYPGALFMSAGGYHHHLGANTWSPGPSPSADQARLLAWELIVPAGDDASEVGHSLRAAGYTAEDTADGVTAADPWDTRVRIRAVG